MDAIKERVYSHIVEYLDFEGYSTEANPYFKEVKVSDLVLYTIGPILSGFKNKTKCKICLEREKRLS